MDIRPKKKIKLNEYIQTTWRGHIPRDLEYELNEYDYQYIEEYNTAHEHPLNEEKFV